MVHGNIFKVLPKICFITWQHEPVILFHEYLEAVLIFTRSIITPYFDFYILIKNIIKVLMNFTDKFPKTKSMQVPAQYPSNFAVFLGRYWIFLCHTRALFAEPKVSCQDISPKGRYLKVNRWPHWGILASNEPLQLQPLQAWTKSALSSL